MFATLKVVGVPPEAIGRLHALVQGPECLTQESLDVKTSRGNSKGRQPYVKIEKSSFDTDYGSYTVEFKLFLVFQDMNEYNTYQPIYVLRSLLQSIDPQLAGNFEQRVPTARKAAELHQAELLEEAHSLEDLIATTKKQLLKIQRPGQVIYSGGRVILNARECYTDDNENPWHLNGVRITDLDLSDSSQDPFKSTLIALKSFILKHARIEKELGR